MVARIYQRLRRALPSLRRATVAVRIVHGMAAAYCAQALPMAIAAEARWEEFVDVKGRTFYHNRATGESSWTPPEGFLGANDEAFMAAAAVDTSKEIS